MAEGGNHSGNTVNVFRHGRHNPAANPDPVVLFIVRLFASPPVTDDRVVSAQRTSPRQQSQRNLPRVGVVFRLWQCDKENQGWREGPPLTVLPKFRSADRPSPSGKLIERKKNIAFSGPPRAPHSEHWPV